jgi:hypothetical protein
MDLPAKGIISVMKTRSLPSTESIWLRWLQVAVAVAAFVLVVPVTDAIAALGAARGPDELRPPLRPMVRLGL